VAAVLARAIKHISTERHQYSRADTRSLLTWGLAGGDERFNEDAALKTGAVLVPIDSFAAACAFGLLAVELFTTTGMRMNESMQIRLDPDCFVCLEMPAPPGAQDRTPRLPWQFRLIPKGEREN
jgi:hypothetical protein